MKSFPSWHLHVLGGGFCCFIQWMEEENFSRIVKGRLFFLKWSQRYHPKIHPVPPAPKEGENLRKSHRSVWCVLTAFSCSIALEVQLLIHSLCLTLQLLLSCPIPVPPAQPALNIRLKTNGLVTVEAADCDQNHEQQKAESKAMGSQLLTSSAPSILNRV